MNRRTLTLIALVIAVLVGGWLLTRNPPTTPPTATPTATPITTARDAGAGSAVPAGMSTCPLDTLPPEAADTVDDIHSDGPFPFPRNDGVVFGNRESHLPAEAKGYYREYTVVTPGASTRSVRRIVTGGSPPTDPREYFYTDDHYNSFCLITGAGGRS